MTELEEIERAGAEAFAQGALANDCPYSFVRSDYFPKDFAGFHEHERPKLDAWMRGWMAAKKRARGQ
jgi:hypothetical protein